MLARGHGRIVNLAAPDMLVWWTEEIPWISSPDALGGMLYLGPFFNLLPLIAVGLRKNRPSQPGENGSPVKPPKFPV